MSAIIMAIVANVTNVSHNDTMSHATVVSGTYPNKTTLRYLSDCEAELAANDTTLKEAA